VTSDALSFAFETLKIEDAELHRRLMTLYLSLNVYPDVIAALERLRAGGMRLAILSNGTPQMLASAATNSGIADLLDAVLSVEEVGVFKPHPSVYKLASDRLQLAPDRICFLSSNGWDAYAAKAFGFHAVWCNRFNQPPERIPGTPDGQIATLAASLPAVVLS
jgi:2-haloacid dehalogenase